MTPFIFANNIKTTLASAVSSTATTITLASSTDLPSSIPAGYYLPITLNDAATGQIYEIVYATAVSGASLTVLRAQEGTSAGTWAIGDFVFSGPTAGQMTPTTAEIISVLTAAGITPSASSTTQLLAAEQKLFAAINGSASEVFNVADAATATEALPLGQAQADFAAINGSASEAFNVSNLYASTGVFSNIQVFTSSGTFTVPAGVTKVRVTVVGGGAAGSACNGTTVGGGGFSGAGGGSGGAAIGIYSVTPGTAYTVTVGAAQTTSNAAGNTSSFGSLASATGGEAVAFFPTSTNSPGSGGGTGLGGSINIDGGYGSDGQAGTAVFAGNGGNSIFGGGGRAGNNGGVGGQTFGAGGGGAYNGTSGVGGAGAAGIVIVEW